MDSLEYNGFTTDSDAFIELEDFDCFTELESSYAVYANRLSRSQYTLGTTDNFEHNHMLENEVITVPKNFLRLNSFNKKSESFTLLSYNKQSEYVFPSNQYLDKEFISEIFATKESQELLFLLSKTEISSTNKQIMYSKFELKDRIFSNNKSSDNSSFDISINQSEPEIEKIEKIIEKTKQISVQNKIDNKQINYKFDTTKFEQKNSNVVNNRFESINQPEVTQKDLNRLKKDLEVTILEEINKNKEKTLIESEAISKKIVANEFSKFLR